MPTSHTPYKTIVPHIFSLIYVKFVVVLCIFIIIIVFIISALFTLLAVNILWRHFYSIYLFFIIFSTITSSSQYFLLSYVSFLSKIFHFPHISLLILYFIFLLIELKFWGSSRGNISNILYHNSIIITVQKKARIIFILCFTVIQLVSYGELQDEIDMKSGSVYLTIILTITLLSYHTLSYYYLSLTYILSVHIDLTISRNGGEFLIFPLNRNFVSGGVWAGKPMNSILICRTQ